MDERTNLRTLLKPVSRYLTRPIRLVREYDRDNFRPDFVAGLTLAVIMLPQAIAIALIAELPPQMGLYSAIIAGIIGALWGSSNQVHTGPANAISLLVLSSLQGTGLKDPGEIMLAAGLMAVMVGIFQLTVGMARLGILVNFVSHSVIVGFSTGAGVLIITKQAGPLLGLSFSSRGTLETLLGVITNLAGTHWPTAALGVGAIACILLLRRINSKLPAALLSMILASFIVFLARLDQAGVSVIGKLPSTLPPIVPLPLFDLRLISRLSTGALAAGAIGLVQTVAIARSIATQTGQRLETDQELVGQGMANIAVGFFSGYPASGSFARTAVNLKAGARTPLAAVISSLFVLIAMITLGPLTAFLPRTAVAGVLIITAYGMIDSPEIKRIWRGTRGDATIMLATFLGTIFLDIELAVLLGIMFSFARYIMRISAPQVREMVPDELFEHFEELTEGQPCPQLGVIDILGDLYFGAVNQVEEALQTLSTDRWQQRFLLIRMHHVNNCDFSGIHMLEEEIHGRRERGGDVFFVQTIGEVRRVMTSTKFDQFLGEDHFLSQEDAISHLFLHVLDPAVCIYECPLRIFKECQNLPKQISFEAIPEIEGLPDKARYEISPVNLLRQMESPPSASVPCVVDVREPREFRRGHIPGAISMPLSRFAQEAKGLPRDRQIVLVCRSGQRSRLAIHTLIKAGYVNCCLLRGGLLAWEAAGLDEASE